MGETIKKCEYMNSLFRYIEDNISGDLNIDMLSKTGYVSSRKLKNDFYDLSGHSVMEYIRKRRLSNALALIKLSAAGFAEIADFCGYSSQQALCRAVKQTLGLTPTEYKNGSIYYFFPPYSGEPLQSITVSNITLPRMLRIQFFHTKLKGIEDAAVNTFLRVFPNYNGRIFGRNGKQTGRSFCYELYLTDLNIDLNMLTPYGYKHAGETRQTNTTFAAATVPNDEQKINAAWNYLYFVWQQNSMYKYSGEPYYEEYMLRNNKPFKLKLYLPLMFRDEETKISIIDNPGLRFVTSKAKGRCAEETASRAVIEYLRKHCPHIINMSKETYIQKGDGFCVCGVLISPSIQLPGDENVKNIFTGGGKYLVLECGVMGDYKQTAALLSAFAADNGMDVCPDKIFAVYDAKKGFNQLQMKMYCPVKICPK